MYGCGSPALQCVVLCSTGRCGLMYGCDSPALQCVCGLVRHGAVRVNVWMWQSSTAVCGPVQHGTLRVNVWMWQSCTAVCVVLFGTGL